MSSLNSIFQKCDLRTKYHFLTQEFANINKIHILWYVHLFQ